MDKLKSLREVADYIISSGIEMVNFMYPAADGRLKTLNFTVNDEDYLLSVLRYGERVDGSSLFPFIEAGNSDLYVVPRLGTMFLDPFSELPTACFLCAFLDKNGRRLDCSPEYTLLKARDAFRRRTGMDFEAMGELEFYVCAPEDDALAMYPATDQKGYHESAPFAKFNDFRTDRLDGRLYEQNEIEFLPVDVADAADQLMLAKWIIRNTAAEYGLDVSFAPKITAGKAGSGLHIHMRIMKDGRNMLVDEDGRLSQTARRAIAGLMTLAPSITAFGNANPVSYLRLVPHQEAPTSVCWGDRNRSVLVRVPLGWTGEGDMFAEVNGADSSTPSSAGVSKQTFEIRSADCSADIYQLLSALCVACMHGLEMPDADAVAERTYVDVDIHKAGGTRAATLEQLPGSCAESAVQLERRRGVYEQDGIFSPLMIDGLLKKLRDYDDGDLRQRLAADPKLEAELVARYYYCG